MQYLNIRVSLSIKIQNNKNRIATKHPKVYLIMEIKMKKSKLNFASNSGGTIATKNQFPDCQCRLLMSFFVDGTNLINSTTNKHEFIRIFHLLSTKSGNLNTNNSKLVNCCYDANGNLTNDGEYSYSYNMENRLIEIKNEKLKMKNFYDGIGRKVKSLEINLTTGETNETKFIYNNWNVIQEITTSQLHSLTSSYFWGSDLSGSLHGAGGIGGLIANSPFSKGGGGGFYFYNYDANGNVINLINSKGETAAHYEYSPFGKTISKTGYYAETNKFRFSTKRFEKVGKLYYYGYRYYKPKTGNWLTRDPIVEYGFLNYLDFIPNTILIFYKANLYEFINNAPINNFDVLGLACQNEFITFKMEINVCQGCISFSSIVSIYGIAKYELDKNCNCIFKEIRVLSMKANNNSQFSLSCCFSRDGSVDGEATLNGETFSFDGNIKDTFPKWFNKTK